MDRGADGAEVIAVAVDVGQGGEDLEVIRKRAIECGAVEAEVADARDEFMTTTARRPARQWPVHGSVSLGVRSVPTLIVRHLVDAAHKYSATIVSHGCTSKGNDQVRFEVGISNLAPELTCIAPVRDYAMTRDKAIEFAETHGLPIDVNKSRRTPSTRTSGAGRSRPGSSRTSGTASSGPVLLTSAPDAAAEPDEVIIEVQGVPVAIDGHR